jgi:hypothetical protein
MRSQPCPVERPSDARGRRGKAGANKPSVTLIAFVAATAQARAEAIGSITFTAGHVKPQVKPEGA